MQNTSSALPFIESGILLIIGIYAVVGGYKLILSGIHEQRKHRVRWYRQPKIVLGIGVILTALTAELNGVVFIFARRYGLSMDTITWFGLIGSVSIFLLGAVVCYTKLLEVLNRRLEEEN